jgi:phosphoserine phosphatase RsbU/P
VNATARTDSEPRTARALYALLDLAKALSSAVEIDALMRVIEEKAPAVVDAERTTVSLSDGGREIVNSGSVLTAPIISSSGDVVGIVQSEKRQGERFDESDESLIAVIASHAAVAIDRARFTAVSLENERLAAGLKLASEIQMRMLPSATVTLSEDSPFEMHAYIRPAKMVGGDLYDFALKGNRLYFCIGDVSGKGIGSALIMALTKTLFRANVAYYADAAKLMEAVNLRLYEETGPTMFVTAFCGFLDLNDGILRFSNAGHDRPFLLRRDGRVEVLESKPGLALGVMPKFRYPLQQMTLGRGDALFLYTDGVTEATDASEQLFTIDRLQDTLESCAGETAVRVLEEAIDAVDRFVRQAPQADDIAMMCIRYRGRRKNSSEFPRDLAALSDVVRLAQHLDQSVRYPVELALEELFTNIVRHNPSGRGNIRIDLAIHDSEVVITITDFDTPRFDPVSDAPQVDVNQPLEMRTEGGLGIHLVKKMMDTIEYSHQNRTGTITLRKRMH